MMATQSLLLASASPRRRDLLTQIGVSHRIAPQNIDETRRPGEAPEEFVRRMATEKAAAAVVAAPGSTVLAADTIVVLDDTVLGKPAAAEQAQSMLLQLSARQHTVLTAVTVADQSRQLAALSSSKVTFRCISTQDAQRYWQTGEPDGKAGSYAIQGLGAVFVRSLSGSYSGVMGLPLFETAELLKQFGIACWQPVRES